MKIRLKLFASLAKYLPEGAVRNIAEVELPDGTSVEDAIRHCGVPTEHCHMALVDGVYVAPSDRSETVLTEGLVDVTKLKPIASIFVTKPSVHPPL